MVAIVESSTRRRFLMLGLKTAAALITIYCFYVILFAAPYILYRLRSPKGADECHSIRPGLTLSDAESVLRSKTEPHELRYSPEQIVSARGDGTCSAQLNVNQTVVSVRFDPNTRWTGWPGW